MRLHVTKNRWTASYGFAVIAHPYHGSWEWDLLIGNRNYTISFQPRKQTTPNDFYNRSCETSGHIWASFADFEDRCIYCGIYRSHFEEF